VTAFVLAAVAGIAAGLIATGVARRIALRLRVLNDPNPINRDHVTAIPYLGGLGIAVGVAVGILVALVATDAAAPPLGIVVGGLGFLLIGLLDDLHTYGAGRKLALQALAAGLAVVAGGVVRPITGIEVIDMAFAFLWIVGLVNAFNFIDVSDGLATSVAVTTFGLLALVTGHELALAGAVVGAGFGFLAWNRPPARIFMGDAGSLFLGFLLATFLLTAEPLVPAWPFLGMLALFAAVPLFDMAFQTLMRAHQGRPWYVDGPDSFALHLRRAGASKWLVVALAVLATGLTIIAAEILPTLGVAAQIAVLAVATLASAAVWRGLLLASRRAERTTAAAAPIARTALDDHHRVGSTR
jgi:UDP-GlcNAc:undecaprenyl-phosphate/decaprenyl-phosphate GlcNAc-1-phosphate transferase